MAVPPDVVPLDPDEVTAMFQRLDYLYTIVVAHPG
jgi:hypothetical protein